MGDNRERLQAAMARSDKARTTKEAKQALLDALEIYVTKDSARALVEHIEAGIPVNLKKVFPIGVLKIATRFRAVQVAELAEKNLSRG